MGLNLYPICHRGREDCEPIHCIASEPEGITEEEYMSFDYTPPSFVCSGRCSNPKYKQDAYRLCFKNGETDEMTDNDMQDLTSIIAVVSASLNYDAVMKVNSGVVEIPAAQTGKEEC
jgi:hypothetical protein